MSADMRIWTRPLGPFATNCYIVSCVATGVAAIIDPGQPDDWIHETVIREQLTVALVLLTHGHVDHIGGVAAARRWWGRPLYVHPADEPMLADPVLNGSTWVGQAVKVDPPDGLLHEGDEVAVGELRFRIIQTPGHTPGGVCLYAPGHLIAGDTLFAGSVGRTDLPGGDFDTLMRSIREKLYILPDATRVYPGHGPDTTIGHEATHNPFVTRS